MSKRLNRILNSQSEILKHYGNPPRAGHWDEVNKLYVSAAGKCNICGTLKGKRNHALDHNHKTGKFRGILCMSCNTGLGMFKDDARLLLLAIDYLEKYK